MEVYMCMILKLIFNKSTAAIRKWSEENILPKMSWNTEMGGYNKKKMNREKKRIARKKSETGKP